MSYPYMSLSGRPWMIQWASSLPQPPPSIIPVTERAKRSQKCCELHFLVIWNSLLTKKAIAKQHIFWFFQRPHTRNSLIIFGLGTWSATCVCFWQSWCKCNRLKFSSKFHCTGIRRKLWTSSAELCSLFAHLGYRLFGGLQESLINLEKSRSKQFWSLPQPPCDIRPTEDCVDLWSIIWPLLRGAPEQSDLIMRLQSLQHSVRFQPSSKQTMTTKCCNPSSAKTADLMSWALLATCCSGCVARNLHVL